MKKQVTQQPYRKYTNKEAQQGFVVCLSALRAIAGHIKPERAAIYAADVVKNVESGNFLKPSK